MEGRQTRTLGPPTWSGGAIALVFWWQSLTPTLIPRAWWVQGVTSALCLAIGYGIGTLAGRWAKRALEARDRMPGPTAGRRAALGLAAAAIIAAVAGSALWIGWQNAQRQVMGMAEVGPLDALLMVPLSALVGAAFVVVGRLAGCPIGAVNRFNHRHLPAALAAPLTILLLLTVVVIAGRQVIWRGLTVAVNATYGPADLETNPGTVQPTMPSVSGSAASLVSWASLGRWGRDFAAQATTRAELEAFHGESADLADPVRVYAGLRSAEDAEQRADLAVRDLERAGGFDREVLVVWTPTGSGWMDPDGTRALEYVTGGDSAIVAIQYSYLPSLWALTMDEGAVIEAGTALFNAVHERWSELPEASRPTLLVFGLSLGSAGAEAPFAGIDAETSLANLVSRTDGALIVGGKKSNPIISQVTAARDAGSPPWQPRVDADPSVRFAIGDRGAREPLGEWPRPRVLYLQYPSDPVSYWGSDAFLVPPEWMSHPRGHGVPQQGSWFPIVSGVQALADLAFQLSPPPGFGHDYRHDYADAWARVVAPEGWTLEDAERLERFLEAGD